MTTTTMRRINYEDFPILDNMSKNAKLAKQAPSILGRGLKENKALASAYSTDVKDYPVAHLLYNNDECVGIAVAQDVRNASLSVSIIAENLENYFESLAEIITLSKDDSVKCIYISSVTNEKVKNALGSSYFDCMPLSQETVHILEEVEISFDEGNDEYTIRL